MSLFRPATHAAALLSAAILAATGPLVARPPLADGASSSSTDSVVVTDADGHRVALPGPAHRIVSLVPSATLTLGALGERGSVVARTDFDTVSWAAHLPSVGGGLHPSIEAIVAARPDLVVRFGGSQDTRTPARLHELGIPQLAIRPNRIEDIFHIITLLGRVTGSGAAADSLMRSLRSRLDAVHRSVAGLPKVRTVYVLGGSPPWVAGPGTYIDQLITLGGGVNVFSDLDTKYAPVSPEELVARHIDVVLTPHGSDFDRRLVAGVPVRKVSGSLELPGPAVAAAARDVARLLHPNADLGGGG
ncbi:MAG: helical backbone metal receptor [Gemmatimonadetes bacterium]|jgi:iron complex transport system substrate-binding protein|nr:helical backbone metal receptor [Gemmatimonadota bacterium]